MEDAHTHILALNDDPDAAFFGGLSDFFFFYGPPQVLWNG
jgi:hypothetical protein